MYASIVRTIVPLIVGVLLAQAAKIGLNLPEGAVTEIVTVALGGAYYVLARWVEQNFPAVGRFLLSLGFTSKTPAYYKPEGSPTGR